MKKDIITDEQRLLSSASLDDLIKMKMEEEMLKEFEKSKIVKEKQVITDISKVPSDLIFSKGSVFKIFNRKNKLESFINGIQAEAMLGLQTALREKIKSGQMDAFSTENAYVKFKKIVL